MKMWYYFPQHYAVENTRQYARITASTNYDICLTQAREHWWMDLILCMAVGGGGGGGLRWSFLAEYANIHIKRLLFCVIFLVSDLYSLFFYIRISLVFF